MPLTVRSSLTFSFEGGGDGDLGDGGGGKGGGGGEGESGGETPQTAAWTSGMSFKECNVFKVFPRLFLI